MYVYISGPKHRLRFLCEVRVDGFPYVGVGNSSNKKDAMMNSAKDFVQYLLRQNHISAADLPAEVHIYFSLNFCLSSILLNIYPIAMSYNLALPLSRSAI